ncbi:ribosome-recycling factor [Phanerochaete sordida]|uniref:Ribosome-recycling factor n=1 Tax=Phanerochaete sordida TaxID=48140 RepID=A0A9P3G2F9_9APHY|nr:ribosome-recycling factor [Phanerochaete sordida]
MSLSLVRTAAFGARLRLRPYALRSWRPAPLADVPGVRTYASKKKKHARDDDDEPPSKHKVSTGSLVPGSQQILAGEVYFKAEDAMKATVDRYRKEVADMETRATGRVTPAMLGPVRVVAGGNKVRLEEVATVGVREGTTLVVTVFEEQTLKAVETGIYDAKLPGVIPQRVDARTIRVPIPKPTVEARHALYTTAQRHAEDARVHIRKHHQGAVKKGAFKKHSQELDELQELCDKYVKDVDGILAEMKKSTGAK